VLFWGTNASFLLQGVPTLLSVAARLQQSTIELEGSGWSVPNCRLDRRAAVWSPSRFRTISMQPPRIARTRTHDLDVGVVGAGLILSSAPRVQQHVAHERVQRHQPTTTFRSSDCGAIRSQPPPAFAAADQASRSVDLCDGTAGSKDFDFYRVRSGAGDNVRLSLLSAPRALRISFASRCGSTQLYRSEFPITSAIVGALQLDARRPGSYYIGFSEYAITLTTIPMSRARHAGSSRA